MNKQDIVSDNREHVAYSCHDDKSSTVSIVLVNHNGEAHLERLFDSFITSRFYPNYELIVVEQASVDNSMYILEQYRDRLPLRIFRNDRNETFSVASNQGASLAVGDYLLFLNNDMEVTDGWMDAMLNIAQQENSGAVGARLVYPELSAEGVNIGKSWCIQHKGIAFCNQTFEGSEYLLPYNKGNGECPMLQGKTASKVIAVTGACLMVKKAIFLEVGGFDENYIYGYEDVDLCLKLYRHGYDNYYVPNALLFHYEFGTQQLDPQQEIASRRARNRRYFIRRWQRYLERHVLQDKLMREKIFVEDSLLVSIIASEKTPAFEMAKWLESELQSKWRCHVQLIDFLQEEKIYKIDCNTDIVIALEPKYDPLRLYQNRHVLVLAWIRDRLQEWCKNISIQYFHYILVLDDMIANSIYARCTRLSYVFDGNVRSLFEILHNRFYIDQKSVLILSPAPDEELGKTWGDHHFSKDLAKAFQQYGYKADVRPFDQWELPFGGMFVIAIKGSPHEYHPQMQYINIMWNISHPEVLSPRDYDEYDMNYIASRSYTECLRESVRSPVKSLMQCTSVEKFHPVTGQSTRYEVLFVGDSRGRFRQTISDLLPTEYNFSLFGRGWEKYVPKCYIKGDYVKNEDLKKYYAGCDILLNDHWPEMRELGFLSNRLFDGLASGAFILTDAVQGIETDLPEGVVPYNGTREDLRSKIHYWMEHSKARRECAERGMKWVQKHHTFLHRVKEMTKFMKTVRYR